MTTNADRSDEESAFQIIASALDRGISRDMLIKILTDNGISRVEAEHAIDTEIKARKEILANSAPTQGQLIRALLGASIGGTIGGVIWGMIAIYTGY
jgi:hypothetical protein